MKKSFIEFYALAVCFASVFFLIVSVATCLYEGIRAVQPAMTVDGYAYRRSISDETFLQSWPKERATPDPATLAKLRKEAFDEALQVEQRTGVNMFMTSLMYVITAGLVFWLHWKLAQREHAGTSAAAA